VQEFFEHTPATIGSKGLVFVGDSILVYRRDGQVSTHPNELDLPGGAPEAGETPFDTFAREVYEEFGLTIHPDDVSYARKYPSTQTKGSFAFFPVVHLSGEVESHIHFGNEGTEYMLMNPEDFIARSDAWAVLQERTQDYLNSLGKD
jgi:8-oxo-dGTP diphosphatase